MLGDWARPSGRDRVVGLWRPLDPRPAALAAEAVRPALGGIFAASANLRREGARVAARLGIKEIGPLLLESVADRQRPVSERVEMLRALEALQDERLPQAMKLALDDDQARLRIEGRRVLAKLQPGEVMGVLQAALERGEGIERQAALAVLGGLPGPAADGALEKWLDKLLAGQVPLELQLDLLEAAGQRTSPALKDKLARYEATRSNQDLLARYREVLAGGDGDAGRQIFFDKAEVACLRCHKIKGEGGEVGPDLAGIGSRQTREYLLEALVDPNRQIAKGYETVVLETKGGQVYMGVLRAEDGNEVRLMTAEGKLLVVPKDQIEDRQMGKSAMPEDVLKFLSRSELRNLVEFLAGLK
jgi:quinoprotein glucose dehydrogenase